MKKAWHEPDQEQFWRYLKDKKVLETIQPALTLLYQLPVKPTDLHSFFAEYLENGAKTSIQLSLLRAELCFKKNQLDEARNASESQSQAAIKQLVSQFSSLEDNGDGYNNNAFAGIGTASTAVAGSTFEDHSNIDAAISSSKMTLKTGVGSMMSLYTDASDNEMDTIMDFIDEYHAIDPFGILFDFGLRDEENFDAAAEHESDALASSKAEQTVPSSMDLVGKGGGYGRTFFESKLDLPFEHVDLHLMTPKEKLVFGLRKFQEQKRGRHHMPKRWTDAVFSSESTFGSEPLIGHISDNNATRKKLLRVFSTPKKNSAVTGELLNKHERKQVLQQMLKKQLKKFKRKYTPKDNEKKDDVYFDIGISKEMQQQEKLQRGVGFRGSIAPADNIIGNEHEKSVQRTNASFVFDFPLEEVKKTQEWIDHNFAESVWKLNEPLNPTKLEVDSDEYYDDEDDNYVWLNDLKQMCKARKEGRNKVDEADELDLGLPAAILENIQDDALNKARKRRYGKRQGKRKDKKVVDLDNVIAEGECQDKAETKEISAIVEEISLPKAKPVVSVASLLKIPNYTTKRSEQTKSYVRQMFNEKYRKQLLRDFPFDMLDKD